MSADLLQRAATRLQSGHPDLPPNIAGPLGAILASEAKWCDEDYERRRPGIEVCAIARAILGES